MSDLLGDDTAVLSADDDDGDGSAADETVGEGVGRAAMTVVPVDPSTRFCAVVEGVGLLVCVGAIAAEG